MLNSDLGPFLLGMVVIVWAIYCMESAHLKHFPISIIILERKGERSHRFSIHCSLTPVRYKLNRGGFWLKKNSILSHFVCPYSASLSVIGLIILCYYIMWLFTYLFSACLSKLNVNYMRAGDFLCSLFILKWCLPYTRCSIYNIECVNIGLISKWIAEWINELVNKWMDIYPVPAMVARCFTNIK